MNDGEVVEAGANAGRERPGVCRKHFQYPRPLGEEQGLHARAEGILFDLASTRPLTCRNRFAIFQLGKVVSFPCLTSG